MKFLRRSESEPAEVVGEETSVDDEQVVASKAHTPAKGRPTPKRRDAEAKRRGPVAPPPRTSREAMKRNRGSKEERKELAARRREARLKQRERMMSGDDKYLPPREKGPVKAYIRDVVDSQRTVLGLFMPLAILVFISITVPSPVVQQYVTLISLLIFVMMIGQSVILGRKIADMARKKFPKEYIKTGGTIWYVATRAVQIRKLRIPKPRVKAGEKVS
ncbi:DUF3043 domain-containing protein [Labedaea rhizosphaerae]|uniref:DUF3043 family protein n=1 Tax=Labedaea rhizosphaerae TaxID=598644 RepID=A0A4V3CYZ9_LABRH|nr:DUF3043 domain-containing protein [Labedaea rhizosphaerae]TDP96108.1 DUF3043 family protein [Labedaea rhizosphaerae]